MSIYVISPHLDDAIYSAYGALDSRGVLDRGVATVFTNAPPDGQSAWALTNGFADAHEEFRVRRAEDEAVLEQLGASWVHLGANNSDLVGMKVIVREWIVQQFHADPTCLFLIPAGAGRNTQFSRIGKLVLSIVRRPPGAPAHSEHVLVRDVAMDTLRSLPKVRWGFYAENPYVWSDDVERLWGRLVVLAGRELHREVLKPDIDRKLVAAEGYASQADSILGSKRSYRRKILAHKEHFFLASTRTLS
jgi:hypothetical protein